MSHGADCFYCGKTSYGFGPGCKCENKVECSFCGKKIDFGEMDDHMKKSECFKKTERQENEDH